MNTKSMLKWPLIIAAILVVLRVVLEQAGAPGFVSNLSSVVFLYLVAAPVYFAIRIADSGTPHPYRTLLKTVALFTALARAIVIPTYWLAYIYQWQAPRFSLAQGGVVGPGVTPFRAYVGIPLLALAIWVITSLIVGGGVGSAVIAIKRKSAKKLVNV